MNVTVRFFARARDLAGLESAAVKLPEQATVDLLKQRLAEIYPQLTGLLERSAVALNNEFAAGSTVLTDEAEVALLPPVSGG